MPEQRQAKMLPARLAALVVALKEGEYNRQELAQLTGLHYLTVLDYCRALHEKHLIHVCKYEKDNLGRESVVIFKWGEGEDVVREKLTRAEQQRRYRERKIKRSQVRTVDYIARAHEEQQRRRGVQATPATPAVPGTPVDPIPAWPFASPNQPLPQRTTVHQLLTPSSNDEGE